MPALLAGIYVFSLVLSKEGVDGRDKPGQDRTTALLLTRHARLYAGHPRL
jgi:hypothetical protein